MKFDKIRFSIVISMALLGSMDAKVMLKGARSQQQQKVGFLPSATRHLDEDNDNGLLPGKLPKKRDCKLKTKDFEKVQFECKAVSDDSTNDIEIEDKIKFKVETSDKGASLKVEYENEVETATEETETSTEYEIFYDRMIEYVKGGGGGESVSEAYDFETDEIVNTVRLQDWNPMSEVVTDDDGIISYFSADTADGMVNFKFTISRASEGEAVTANKMKIDFTLTNYQWQRPGESYVALMSTIESEKKVKVEYDDDAADASADEDVAKASSTSTTDGGKPRKTKKTKKVEINFGEAIEATGGVIPFGDYEWVNFAEASKPSDITTGSTEGTTGGTEGDGEGDVNLEIGDGEGDSAVVSSAAAIQESAEESTGNSSLTEESSEQIEVVATSLVSDEEDGMQTIAFSFVGRGAQNASKISWDPEAGIGYASASSCYRLGSFLTIMASAISTVFFLMA